MLPPKDLASVGSVNKRWRWLASQVWRKVESANLVLGSGKSSEEKIRGSLQSSPRLADLVIHNEGVLTKRTLSLIAEYSPYLRSLTITQGERGRSTISGKDIQTLVRGLSLLKRLSVEGCERATTLAIDSANLETLCVYNAMRLEEVNLQ